MSEPPNEAVARALERIPPLPEDAKRRIQSILSNRQQPGLLRQDQNRTAAPEPNQRQVP